MRKFTDLFKHVTSEQNSLNVSVWRPPNNEHTCYSFDRPLDVHDGSMKFTYKNGEVAVDNLFSSEEPAEPTEESLAIVDKLRAVNGVQFTGSSIFGDMSLETYKVSLFKSAAVPDDRFDRDVITALAEHFGVTLDDVNVTIKDDRNVRHDSSWSMGNDEDKTIGDGLDDEDEWLQAETAWNNPHNPSEDDEDSKSTRERRELAEAARGIRERSGLNNEAEEDDSSGTVRQPATLVDEELPGER